MLLELMKGEPFPAEPLLMTLLLSQHKMIDWLTKQISKYELLDNNNKEVERSKEEEQELSRENIHDYIRKNERIHYIDDYQCEGYCAQQFTLDN